MLTKNVVVVVVVVAVAVVSVVDAVVKKIHLLSTLCRPKASCHHESIQTVVSFKMGRN